MKVVGIGGSPRKNANTTLLLEAALAAAREEGAETELVLLREKHIKPCDACEYCRTNGRCKIKDDDMAEILAKLEAADGILLASPTHVGGVSAVCQAFLERCHSLSTMKQVNGNFINAGKTSRLAGKVGGAIVSGKRRGIQSALDQLNFALIMHQVVLAYGGVAALCKSFEPGAIKDEDPDAVNMAAELGRIMTNYIKKLSNNKYTAQKIG